MKKDQIYLALNELRGDLYALSNEKVVEVLRKLADRIEEDDEPQNNPDHPFWEPDPNPIRLNPGAPGCSCSCHVFPGVYHVVACCYPDLKYNSVRRASDIRKKE